VIINKKILVSGIVAALAAWPAFAQQQAAPAATSQTPTVKTTVDEVLLDFVVRDKKGKPVTDLQPSDLTVLDNGVKQELTSFRQVQGAEAISDKGTAIKLDPLRQVRLVTLAFEALGEPDQRKTARTAAIDLVKGGQGANVFYSVVVINTRLMVLQQFTDDRDALIKAINEATAGYAAARLLPESDRIKADLRRYLNSQGIQPGDQSKPLTTATQTLAQPLPTGAAAGAAAVQAKLVSIMLDMLRMEAAFTTEDARMSLTALESLVRGLQGMPGRKSVLYFSTGMTLPPELDAMFRNLTSMANRANVTFYSVDTRGVIAGYGANTRDIATGAQNAAAADQLGAAAGASATTVTSTGEFVTKEEIMASDNAETSARANVQLPIRNLAEATGGFLIGESNDLRTPLRHVNEEIGSYYELSYNPRIDNYDGSFRRVRVNVERKDVRVYARNGYFALPPEARAAGLEAFELPLLKAIADGKLSQEVEFRAGAMLLQPRSEGTDVDVLVEVPLHHLQPKASAAANFQDVHFSLGALVKNPNGEVVEKLTRDRSFRVTPEQLKMGNFVEKLGVTIPPGKYTLESAVMDRESGKIGVQRSEFTVPPKPAGVAISSLTGVRSFTPAKGLNPNDPFQFQGQSITPTMNESVARAENSVLRLFFVVYQERSIAAKPTVEIEFLQNGKSLTKVPLPLPDADAQGRIPYVMTIPAAAIPPGVYQVRARARQGDTTSEAQTEVKIEQM
jgi:VWFA-related protein